MKEKFCIIDSAFSKNPTFYAQLQKRLEEVGVDLSVLTKPSPEMEYFEAVLLASPMRTKFFDKQQKILGLRTINRKERLEIATEVLSEKYVAPWASPKDNSELKKIVSGWDSDEYIFKYDWSAAKRGVRHRNIQTDLLPGDYNISKDVVMKYLDEDPLTYKVDIFCGKLLNGWVLQTKSIEHEDFLKYTTTPEIFQLPNNLRVELEKLSDVLIQYGCGYTSFDMMNYEGNLKIIELNTNSVGRNISWGNFGSIYLDTYTKAIQHLLKNMDKLPTLGSLEERFFQASLKKSSVNP
jgi:hypothetical protein